MSQCFETVIKIANALGVNVDLLLKDVIDTSNDDITKDITQYLRGMDKHPAMGRYIKDLIKSND